MEKNKKIKLILAIIIVVVSAIFSISLLKVEKEKVLFNKIKEKRVVDRSISYETKSFKIKIDIYCLETTLSCDRVDYLGINKNDGSFVELTGSAVHLTTPSGAPGKFLGYLFKNKEYQYLINEDNLEVRKNGKVILKEEVINDPVFTIRDASRFLSNEDQQKQTRIGEDITTYVGFIDDEPVTLVISSYSDDDVKAYYVYDNLDTPIIINGTQKNGLVTLYKKDKNGNIKETLEIGFSKKDKNILVGNLFSKDDIKKREIYLKKDFVLFYWNDMDASVEVDLLQYSSTLKHYFKVVVYQKPEYNRKYIKQVKVFEKGTDKLLQIIDVDCELNGIENISVGDYNFDGLEDFSVFEAYYAGPNTSSIYILWDPNLKKYIVSGFQGTSLEFDSDSKIIFEHNQCCGGRSHMSATYKVVNNKMILENRVCFEYSDEKEDLIEVECGEWKF